MAFLFTEAAKLSEDRDLVKGVVNSFHEHQHITLAGRLPWTGTTKGAREYNVERVMAGGDSLRPVTSTAEPANDDSQYEKIRVETRMFSRNADVPLAVQVRQSDSTNQVSQQQHNQSKKIAFDFGHQMVNGTGLGMNCHGFEFHLDRWNGIEQPSNGAPLKLSSEHNLITQYARKTYGTNTGRIDGTPQALKFSTMERALRNTDGTGYDMIVGTAESTVWLLDILAAQPGNAAPVVQTDALKGLGSDAFMWRSLPVISSPFVGAKKTCVGSTAKAFGAAVASGSATLTIAAPASPDDDRWVGFSSLDVGRAITVSDNNGANPWTTTIVAVSGDQRTATLAANSARTYTYGSVTLAQRDDVLYFVRLGKGGDGNGGFGVVYNDMENEANANLYEGVERFMGFTAQEQQGRQAGRVLQTQFDLFATFQCPSIWYLQRLTGFAAPSV